MPFFLKKNVIEQEYSGVGEKGATKMNGSLEEFPYEKHQLSGLFTLKHRKTTGDHR